MHACCCACNGGKSLEKEMLGNSARLPCAIITGRNTHDGSRLSDFQGYDDYSKKKMANVGGVSIILAR